jgi:hypothetical protein
VPEKHFPEFEKVHTSALTKILPHEVSCSDMGRINFCL